MGLAFIIVGILVGFWALWVAWETSKAGGVPPYQDSITREPQPPTVNPQWPFPGDDRP